MASRSLGTLTLDLVARTGGFVQGMSKAERKSQEWRKQVEKDLKTVSTGLKRSAAAAAVFAAAGGAALAAMTKNGLEAVDSQNKLARSLDTTYDSVTALGIAFEEGGVDGYDASLARLNRRLGAAENGTGEAAKTVEALNLNLEELSGMEADERIASIADAIRDSGASAQQAARYAQQLGFEQQEAAQFFLQGGDAIRAYRQEVDDFGLAVSAVDAVKVEQANDAFAQAGRIFDGVSQQLAIEVAPILSGISELFVQNAKDAGGVGEVVGDSFNDVIEAAGFVIDAVDGVRRTFEVVGSGIAIFGLSTKEVLLTLGRDIVEIPTAAANEMIRALNDLPGVDMELLGMSDIGKGIQEELDLTQGAIAEGYKDIQRILMEPMPSTRLEKFVTDARTAANESAEELARIQENLKAALDGGGGESGDGKPSEAMENYQALVKDLMTDEERLTEQLRERLAVLDAVSIAQEEDYRRVADSAMTAIPDFSGLSPEVGGAFGELDRLDEERDKLETWYSDQLEMLSEFREERADLMQTWNAQELALEQQYSRQLMQIEQARQRAQLAAAEDLFGNLAEATATFAGEQSDLYKTLFTVQKAAAIAQSAVAIQSGIAQAAANPWPANLAAMASVAAATAGIIGNIQSISLNLDGQAHDGIMSVPQDGTWNLKKGERVTTAETSAKLDATLDRIDKNSKNGGEMPPIVNITENPAKGGQVDSRQERDGQWVIDVMVADVRSGGRASKAYESTYGMRRQGS